MRREYMSAFPTSRISDPELGGTSERDQALMTLVATTRASDKGYDEGRLSSPFTDPCGGRKLMFASRRGWHLLTKRRTR
jgi:hypothetical protein